MMKPIFEEDIRAEAVMNVAERMLIAARTAPKARGIDNLVMAIFDHDGIKSISEKLKEIAARTTGSPFLLRDAENILAAQALVVIGTKIASIGLKPCNLCGFENCEEKDKHPNIPCPFNTGDLGIAIGSAVSVAADARVDNRVMFSVSKAVLEMKLLGADVKIAYAIPLSASSKNPFFDRR
jgi:uncharacterized ferredoxin-like protein